MPRFHTIRFTVPVSLIAAFALALASPLFTGATFYTASTNDSPPVSLPANTHTSANLFVRATTNENESPAASWTYHEPSPLPLTVLIGFLILLPISGAIAQRVLSAALLGQILVGVIFGTPVGGWLERSWEDAWVALGYIGLLGLVFEGEYF